MAKQIIECVPNFSEGRDMNIIDQITNEIEGVDGVKLLDVDPGKATNRTVVTIAGEPEPVIEAAFRAIKKASELIDMSKHKGEHPRFGATDVCPLVPVANITMDETIPYAHKLGERVGKELGLSGYFYENAAKSDDRRNLAKVRSGEYEGLSKKLSDPSSNSFTRSVITYLSFCSLNVSLGKTYENASLRSVLEGRNLG